MKNFILVILTFCSTTVFGQTTISGTVKNSTEHFSGVTISLLKAKDSGLVKLALSDTNGIYSFPAIAPGNYFVKATSPGHNTAFSKPFRADSGTNVQVEELKMHLLEKELAGVTVSTKKPFIERQIDKTVMNVDASISSAGTTALEMLEKAPGVMVDHNGNITLQGKGGVQIMIDGKLTYMSNTDLTNYLRNLPSSTLETVEIMTNPSSKYDAAGTSGIINLRTKKTKVRGFNGNLSLSYGQGRHSRTGNSLNLNFRRNKVNLFGNFNQSYRKNSNELFLDRDFLDDNNTRYASFSQANYRSRSGNGLGAKIGMDYYLSPKTTLGIVGRANQYKNSEKSNNTADLMNASGALDSVMKSASVEDRKWRSRGVNLNFRHQFDSTGRELTADADYIYYPNNQQQDIDSYMYANDGSVKSYNNLLGLLPSNISIYSINTDYSQKLWKDAKMETGVKVSKVNTENFAGYFNVIRDAKMPDYNKSNNFDYKEQIAAAYLNLNKQIKKVGVQAGLRLENTNYTGMVYGNPERTDSSFSKIYTSLFPTLYVSYAVSKKHNLGFNLGRRISRPDYESLNPFLSYLDRYTLSSGNPYLLPAYTNTAEVNYSYNNWLNVKLIHSRDKDLISGVFEQHDLITIQKEGNFGYRKTWGTNVSAQVPVQKWWNMNIYAEGNLQHYNTMLQGKVLDIKIKQAVGQMQNSFTLPKKWAAELTAFYGFGFNEGQLLIDPLWAVGAGVSKKILKDKGAVKLNVRDIFRTQNASGHGDFSTAKAYFHQEQDNRIGTLTFTYNFGKPFKAAPKRNTGGASDEQSRVKNAD